MNQLKPRPALFALLILTGVIYLSLWSAPPLAWDDDSNIFANPFFRAGVWSEFWRNAYFGLYVPVTSLVWQILYALGGGRAWPFRALNAGLHVVNVGLAYALIRRRAPAWAAVFGAAIFAWHPLQTATVAWISGGRDLIAGFFALVCLNFWARGRRAGALIAFALALLGKPSVVTLPLVWIALTPNDRRSRRDAPWVAAGLLLSALAIWQTALAQAGHPPEVAWWQRPWLMGDAYWFYLNHALAPWPLAVNYARTPEWVFAHSGTLITAVVPYVIAIYALIRKPRWTPYAAAAALLVLPVSGLVSFGYQSISGVADHYAYLALLPIAMWASTEAARATDRRLRFGRAAALVAVTAFVGLTIARLQVWRDNDAFFNDMARGAPTAYATGIGMSGVACGERQDFDAGVRWTEVALRARPLDVRALANQAYCLLHAGRPSAVAALDFYLDRMDLAELERSQPTGYASLLASIGSAQIAIGEYDDGYQYLCEAARLLPSEPTHRRNLEVATALLTKRHLEPKCDEPSAP